MTYYIKSPAHFCEGSNSYSTIDIIVDIENGRIELVSEDKKDIIRLDLIGANELGDTLQKITDSKRFQTALVDTLLRGQAKHWPEQRVRGGGIAWKSF